MRVIILLGPPGSGKGTQARFLREKFDLEYIGSGELLRERAKKDDFTGNKLNKVLDEGIRVATPVVFRIWMDKLEKIKHKEEVNGIIFDGSPRTKPEAKMLQEALEWYEWNQDKNVLFIDISKEKSIGRLTKRRVCVECGRNIPWVEGYKDLEKCDKCGGKLVRRSDDTKEDIEQRWSWFETDVRPAINYYKERNELVRIDGEQTIEKVHEDILNELE